VFYSSNREERQLSLSTEREAQPLREPVSHVSLTEKAFLFPDWKRGSMVRESHPSLYPLVSKPGIEEDRRADFPCINNDPAVIMRKTEDVSPRAMGLTERNIATSSCFTRMLEIEDYLSHSLLTSHCLLTKRNSNQEGCLPLMDGRMWRLRILLSHLFVYHTFKTSTEEAPPEHNPCASDVPTELQQPNPQPRHSTCEHISRCTHV
jgi:hypothetical protein